MNTTEHEKENRPGGNQTGLDTTTRDETHGTTPYEVLTAEDARQLTDRIKASMSDLWELVVRAYHQRIWVALDYSSWDEYCRQEFGTIPLRSVEAGERAEIIAGLRESGMSIRAIASATHTGTRQVQEALSQLCSQTTVETVVSLDGKTRPAKRKSASAEKSQSAGQQPNSDIMSHVVQVGDDFGDRRTPAQRRCRRR